MKLSQTTNHRSIKMPLSYELPNFVVLTGINGSGKTHLLQAIAAGHIQISELQTIIHSSSIRYVESNYLASPKVRASNKEHLDQKVLKAWEDLKKIQPAMKERKVPIDEYIGNRGVQKIIGTISQKAGKHPYDLSADDFFKYYPLNDNMENIFFNTFSDVFKRYNIKYHENKYLKFLFSEGEKTSKFLSDEEFINEYGQKPWEFVNKVLKEAHLDYSVNYPESPDPNTPFDIKLLNQTSKEEVQFTDLSSGEKVIMGLSIALYNSKFGTIFPKVLLLDELDASLHPSMCKQFLDIIENVFVKDNGIKVIITTHSPATVALCKEESLYVMNKTGKRIEKTTKDKALKILTVGVPSLSINYENRRQVFVESKYDVALYEKVCEKLKAELIPEISLNFISSGVEGSGSCSQVKTIVRTISGFGNKSVFGIVDWDMKNKKDGYIRVLGEYKRYSIENYIFDPLLITAFLLMNKYIKREEIKLSNNESHADIKNLSPEKLQEISDLFIDMLNLKSASKDNPRIKVMYANRTEIEIPEYYLLHNGHDLEQHIINKFAPLKKYKENLKNEIISKIMDDIPELIPMDILEVLKEIQTYG